ncbi:hypothetical protein VN12_19695 [Pirellula sp. SH-Sr6A]|uniref:hypothetical protein n=1 Tax=Pirellula sp. SH-Sr6A TaxID=1632865 RepID=UPI00078D684F|nr:hypothetical protein [Pirellula sp. SH-Sr6A]AMV30880.1 hypothetical protein VN12_02110 [Pirellula sp. SH-Sr6A]AMV31301.1 hypothetical protein VN12_04235 [Pirellula sp. SH-Sr6A]AMV34359.1 hypothetical protein VN12_19695 [Pirellula sp. SH-Sr6A]
MSANTEEKVHVECEKKTVLEVRVRRPLGVARVVLDGLMPTREGESGGRVFVDSEYGDWSYAWYSIGKQSLAKFLATCDYDYIGRKFLGGKFYVRDDEGTVSELRKVVLQMRRQGDLSKDKSRHEWELIEQLEDGYIDWRGYVDESNLCEAWEYGVTKPDPQFMAFWNQLWVPHIVPALLDIDAK